MVNLYVIKTSKSQEKYLIMKKLTQKNALNIFI